MMIPFARAAALFSLVAAVTAVHAQQVPAAPVSTPPPPPPAATFVIKGFDVTGDNPLPASEVTRVLAPYLRTDATIDTLQKATAALEAALKEKGYDLHRVALPPQEIGSAVKLEIVKFAIGKVSVDGNKEYSEANIRASLPELQEGTAPNFRILAVQTAIANESQGKRVQVALKESEEPDRIDARVVVQENKPWNFSASASNTGSAATGNDRVTLSGGHVNLWDLDHQLSAAFTTSLEQPNAVRQFGLNYRAPFYRLGGVLGASYTQSDVAGDFGVFKSNGSGSTMGLNYSHYLRPDGGFRDFLVVGIDNKRFDVTQINGVPLAGQTERRSVPITLGYNARLESDSANWGYNVDLATNLPVGTGNDLASYQTEDCSVAGCKSRIGTVRWTALRGAASYTAAFAEGWLWSVRAQFQYSADALMSGEQFGIGGSTSVRGTSERPLSGDSGLVALFELTTPELVTGLRLVGFLDGGVLSNNNAAGTAKPATDSLSGVGLGLRFAASNYAISADYGRIVGGSTMPFVPNSGIPQSGDSKVHVSLSARF